MSVKTLRSNRPQAMLLSFILGAVVYVAGIFGAKPNLYTWQTNSPLFGSLQLDTFSTTNTVLGIILVFLIGLLMRYVCDKHQLYSGGTQLTFVLSVVLLSTAHQAFGISALTIGGLLSISLIDYSFRIQESNRPNDLVFMGSLTVGAMTIVYTPYSLFIILVWLAYLYSGHTNLKGILISITGFILPTYFLFAIAYLLDAQVNFTFIYEFHLPVFGEGYGVYWLLALLILMAILSIGSFFNALNFNKVVVKNNYILLLVFGLISVSIALNREFGFRQGIALLSFLLAPLLSNHFMQAKKMWLSNLQFYLILGLILTLHLIF